MFQERFRVKCYYCLLHIGAAGLPAIIITTTIKYCYFQSAKRHDVTF